MEIGLETFFGSQDNLGQYIAEAGPAIEDAGIAAVWLPEHVVSFVDYDPRYPYPYSDDHQAPPLSEVPMSDPLISLAALAMVTTKVKLCSGIAILPQRNPVYFAAMASDVDLVSDGRFVAGVGLGWSAQEYEALGVDFKHRGSRMDEYLQVVKSLWVDDVSCFEGRFYTLPDCVLGPKPKTSPHPPLYIGGESDAALRRVARFGDGWSAFRLTPEQLAPRMKVLETLLEENGRTRDEVDVVVSPAELPCDADAVARYAELGVSQVFPMRTAETIDELRRELDTMVTELVEPAQRL